MLLHLTPLDSAAPSLPGPEGFVHLCWPGQLKDVLARHFDSGPAKAFVLDEDLLPPSALREEDTYGHGAYPHLYVAIPTAAVISTHEVALGSDDRKQKSRTQLVIDGIVTEARGPRSNFRAAP